MSLLELTLENLGDAPTALFSRALGGNDLALLRPGNISAMPVKKMRESHHALARLLASGMKNVEVSAITGYSQSRISILKADPAFQELMQHYTEIKDSAFADVYGQMSALSVDVLTELRERLEDSPENFGNSALMNFLAMLLDRTGHGPKSKVENVTVHVTGEELAQLKQLAKESQQGYVTSKLDALTATPSVSSGHGAKMDQIIEDGAKH